MSSRLRHSPRCPIREGDTVETHAIRYPHGETVVTLRCPYCGARELLDDPPREDR